MKTEAKGLLESFIQEFLDEICDGDLRPDNGLFQPDLASQMTTAAEAVFDSSHSGQKYFEQENSKGMVQ